MFALPLLPPVYLVLAGSVVSLIVGLLIGFLWARQAAQERLLTANGLAADERRALSMELAAVRQREEMLKERNDTLNEQLKVWFENTATRVLQATSAQSRQQLDGILLPVRERLEGFQKRVEEVYGKEAEQRITLKAQIDQLHQANRTLSEGADTLARALKGDSQKRGQWGEMILDNVLRASGLRDGLDYTTQGRGLGLKGEAGEHQKPDVIVTLSGGKRVVIDSKVSLVSYVNWVALDPDCPAPQREEIRRAFTESVKAHIRDLSGKRYQDNGKLLAHEYVLMFIPIESALACALDGDSELSAFAWARRVALVGPTTLLLTLNIINAALQLERQEHNAADIAKEAGALYNQIRLVAESLNKVDDHLTKARAAHEQAIKQLTVGRGNVLGRVESFRARGITPKDLIPPLKVGGVAILPEGEDPEESTPEKTQSAPSSLLADSSTC